MEAKQTQIGPIVQNPGHNTYKFNTRCLEVLPCFKGKDHVFVIKYVLGANWQLSWFKSAFSYVEVRG